MTPKQRVHAVLNRQVVDRVPIFMWFHPGTAGVLGELLEIAPGRVAEAMGNDVRQTWVSNNHAMEGIVHEHDGQGHTDYWGIEWVKQGYFNQVVRSPLQDAADKEMLEYKYPYDCITQLLDNMEPLMVHSARYFIGCDVSPCVFEMVSRVRGMEQTLLDIAARGVLADIMLKRAADFSFEVSDRACKRFKLDWLWTGDDIAGQQSMFISPSCWRDMIKPHMGRLFALGKSYGLWNAYHSCGSIRPVIPDLIEMGLDVLNPIQCNCPGMNPYELKKEFGRKLSFMGGIDTQRLLPNGTVSEIREETERLLNAMTADGGGYILAASHTIPPETPVDNIFTMYEVAGLSRQEIFDRAADIRKTQIHAE